MAKITGVYIIQSIGNPRRVYVGSAASLTKREASHFYLLKNNKHYSKKLQNHYNKYGKDDLVFEVIESGDYLDKNHLLAREQGWFYHFHDIQGDIPYFNIAPIAGSRAGVKESAETNKKNSERNKGNNPTQETRNKISKALSNKPKTKEHNAKVSASLMGHEVTLDTRNKLRLAHRGSTKPPITEETRQRQRIAQAKSKGVGITAIKKRKTVIFISILEAARFFNIDQCIIRTRIKKGYDYNGWYFYKTIKNEQS